MTYINVDRPGEVVRAIDALREAVHRNDHAAALEQVRILREELWEVDSFGRAELKVPT